MEKLALGLLALIVVAVGLFLSAILGIALGALAGWIAGWFFPTTLTALAHLLGLTAPYQVGAACGFVGGFFRAAVNAKD